MNKKIILGALLTVLLIALSVVSIPGCKREDLTPPPAINKDQAIAILVSEIIEPAAEYKGISAFMLSEPLQDDDVVTSESGEDYPIDTSNWFVFIDDEPMALFAHDCRYVFIDGDTGGYDVSNESWPPEINGFSMFDTQNMDRGDLIEIYSVLDSAVPITGSPSQASAGDYGDAPDGQDAYYGVPGRYPTLFNTANSQLGRPGAHSLNTGEETLGVNVNAEVDANDPADPDGVPNLVDADSDERIFVIVEGTQAKLAFTVTVAPNAPNMTRYANALIDFDQNGSWSAGTYGTEWVVVNLEVDVAPGSSETVITPWFSWGNKAVLPSPVWMRLLLAREEVDESLFDDVGGWDGSGQFEYGEVEDYFVFLTDMPLLPWYHSWPPAPGQPPRGNREVELLLMGAPQMPCLGPAEGTCGYDINDYSIIISGGDHAKHLRSDPSKGIKPTPVIKMSAAIMARLTSDQDCKSIANLGPGNNTLSDIGQAFDWLAGNVTCGDRVLIYINGHGFNPDKLSGGGVALKDATGKTPRDATTGRILEEHILRPNNLADFLKKIPCCPNKDCDTRRECCDITVIIDACYAGSFNVTGVTDYCRTVIGSTTDTRGGAIPDYGNVYTLFFNKASRNIANDTNGDKCVSPMEAHKRAVKGGVYSVEWFYNLYNKKWGTRRNQVPWIEPGTECKCKCANNASIGTEKWVSSLSVPGYMDEIEVQQGEFVYFKLEIENNGETNLVDLQVMDFLPSGLEYFEGPATISYDGDSWPREPDEIVYLDGETGNRVWNLEEIEALAPGETIAIVYKATAVELGSSINEVWASAHCAVDPSKVVSDEDTATVTVIPSGDVTPEESLEIGCSANCDCYFTVSGVDYDCGCGYTSYDSQYECGCSFPTVVPQYYCQGCIVTIHLWVQDLTGGSCPIESVSLELGEDVPGIGRAYVWGSGPISTDFFEYTYTYETDDFCGETDEFLVYARNSKGMTIETIGYIVCPPQSS